MTAIPTWRQVQRDNFVRLEPLLDYLEIPPEFRKQILARSAFAMNLPRRLAAKMKKGSVNDPLFRQFVPLQDEAIQSPLFFLDPVEDQKAQKTKKLLHKYEGRVLLVTTSACAMHCRYCFRKNFPYEKEEKGFQEEVNYIAKDSSITEIILSGGDPLSLSDETLGELLRDLNAIAHVKRIRFHTRFPIGIPERIDDSFLQILSTSKKQIIFIVHINHASEIDDDVAFALKQIQRLGIPVLNQAVLLKGVNDGEKTLLELCETLVNQGILPYYLHQLDLVQGSAHFEVDEKRAKELIQFIQEHTSGYATPKLAKEEPGKPSKSF